MKQMQSRRKKKNGGLCRRLLVLALLVGLLANTVGCVGGQSSTAQDTRNGSAQATETSNVAEQNTAASIEAARNLCGSLSYEEEIRFLMRSSLRWIAMRTAMCC